MEKSELDKHLKPIWVQRWLKEILKGRKPEGQSWTDYLNELYEKV
jgi:hypothetical protein